MSQPVDVAVSPPPGPVQQGLIAAKANLLPGLALWAVAGGLLLAYHWHPPTQAFLTRMANLKVGHGLPFSILFAIVSTALVGGLLPVLVRLLLRAGTVGDNLRVLPFALAFWGFKGLEVELLYLMQDHLWGKETDLKTLAIKVLIDQFIYVPFWATPTTVLLYLWKDSGYSLAQTRENLGEHWYQRRAVPVMLANWGVWIPAVVIIYCLPLPLQLPIQNVVLCLWVLMLMVLTSKK